MNERKHKRRLGLKTHGFYFFFPSSFHTQQSPSRHTQSISMNIVLLLYLLSSLFSAPEIICIKKKNPSSHIASAALVADSFSVHPLSSEDVKIRNKFFLTLGYVVVCSRALLLSLTQMHSWE